MIVPVGGDARTATSVEAGLQTTIDVLHAHELALQAVDCRRYGAKFDGTTDDREAIQDAIEALKIVGGGKVRFPAGVIALGDDGAQNSLLFNDCENITIEGAGRGRTIFKLKNGADCGGFNVIDSKNIVFRDLTFDGNSGSVTTDLHGLRLDGTIEGLLVEHCEFKDTYGYGIGIQVDAMRRCVLSDLWIHGTGADAIDSKNFDDLSEMNFMSNIVLWDYGHRSAELASPQTGLDCRGPWQLTNIWVTKPADSGGGIRLREGEAGGPAGLGGHKSHLTNFHVKGSGGALELGLEINVDDAAVSNGYVEGCLRGVQVLGKRASIVGVTAKSCVNDGFNIAPEADHCSMVNCRALSNANNGFNIKADYCRLAYCLGEGNAVRDVNIDAGCFETVLDGNAFLSTEQVNDAGTNTHARANANWKTQCNIISLQLAADSTGSRVATISHGLGAGLALTPQMCQLSLVIDTAVNDYAVKLLRVESINNTEVVVRAIVSEASATVGAKFKLAVQINARP
jgi:hypothetical protein